MDEETKPLNDTEAPTEEKKECCGDNEGTCACQTEKKDGDGCCQS